MSTRHKITIRKITAPPVRGVRLWLVHCPRCGLSWQLSDHALAIAKAESHRAHNHRFAGRG